jgi:hypothetical protein
MLSLLAALLMTFSSLAAIDCPTKETIPPKLMNPEGFRQWLSLNSDSLKTVQDLVCCLPPNYLQNYVISHGGRAGQNGSPESPRMLLFDPNETNPFILAINGGDPYLNQPHNVEVGFIKDKKFEVYDIEFYKRIADMSEKNPVRCMRCHGDNHSEARPFFHMNLASSYVAGANKCSPEEDEIQIKAQVLALETSLKLARFHCLDKAVAQSSLALAGEKKDVLIQSGVLLENLKKLRAIFNSFEHLRFAQILHDTPDYENYKFAILGAEICAGFKPSEWLPAEVATHHNSTKTLRLKTATIETAAEWNDLRNQLKNDSEARKKSLRKILRSDFDLRRGQFRPSFQSWLCPSDPTFQKSEIFEIPKDSPSPDRIFARYLADTRLRLFPTSDLEGSTAALRFLIEGRDIDTAGWTLSFNQQEDFQPFKMVADDLVDLEPVKSAIRSLLPPKNFASRLAGDDLKHFCLNLKDASQKAFAPSKK